MIINTIQYKEEIVMPVNSFENYMLTWKPEKSRLSPPMYLSLAQRMEYDILSGVLKGGTKLPPQRELADYLDLSLNTITRAYTLCEKRGLLYAVTGKGTFVSGSVNTNKSVVDLQPSVINLGVTYSPQTNTDYMVDIIRDITESEDFAKNITCSDPLGSLYQRSAAEKWVANFGIKANGNILLTNGSQNSLNLILTSLFESGDKIVVDQYTYPNFLSLANMLHISLLPVPSDRYGMDTSELIKVLNTNNVKGIYLSPSCSNPQAICMPIDRRKEIADIIMKNNLVLIEDDCYAFLREERLPSIYMITGGRGLYLTELNKAVSPVIRTGMICYSEEFKSKLEQANYNCNLTVDRYSAQIAARAIERKIFEKTIKQHISKINRRNTIYGKYFDITNINSYYQWLELPRGISSTVFESVAIKSGIKVYGSERFLTGDPGGKYFLRISTTTADTEQHLETALSEIKRIIDDIKNKASEIDYTV